MKLNTPFIRPAEPADALSVAEVHVRSWQAAYRGLLPDAYLDGLKPEDRAGRYHFGSTDPLKLMTFVAVAEGAVRGFVTTAPARDPDAVGRGELCALYVHPDWWGRGIGARLVVSARERLLEQGFKAAVLWVLAGNVRAERFYRQHGWLRDAASREEERWGVRVQEIRYQRVLR